MEKNICKANEVIDRLRIQLAGCSVAALGGTKDVAKPEDWGWSPSYQDVLDLRIKYDYISNEVVLRKKLKEKLIELLKDHYWDSLSKDKEGIIQHIESVFRIIEEKYTCGS